MAALSTLWAIILLCSSLCLVTVILGLLFRLALWWRLTVWFVVADLMLGLVIAFLDRGGYAH